MKISFITIFPEYFESFKNHSIIKRSIEKGKVELEFLNIRDFAFKRKVDDSVFGGGPGMLLLIEPIVKALESIKREDSYVILTLPEGERFNQKSAINLSKKEHIIIICGHYEGIDSRIENFIDEKISLGEFIVTGGEGVASIVADSIIRLVPGVIKEESHLDESFSYKQYIEYDQFSKPRIFRGLKVPEVLFSGDHKKIEQWKKENSSIKKNKYLENNSVK